jgi:hypothetical protein
MGSDDIEILGKITLDDSDANDRIQNFSDSTDALGSVFEHLGTVADFVWAQLIVKGIEAAISAIEEAGQAVYEFLQQAVDAAAEEQDVFAQLDNAVSNLGWNAAMTTDQMSDLANQIGALTPLGHDAALAGENLLIRFNNIGHEVFPMVTQAAADLSAATGQGLAGTMRMLGRVLEDPAAGMNSLRRMNIVLSDEEKAHVKSLEAQGKTYDAQVFILKKIEEAYGGAAVAAGQTFHGQLAILHDGFEQLQETLGAAFLPIMTDVVSTFDRIARDPGVKAFFEALAGVVDSASQVFGLFWANLTGGGGTDTMGFIMGILQPITNAFNMFTTGFKTGGVSGGLTDLLGQFGISFEKIKLQIKPITDALAELWAAIQKSFPAMKDASGDLLTHITQTLGTELPKIIKNVGVFIAQLAEFWSKHGDEIIKVLGIIAQMTFTTITFLVTTISGAIALFMTLLNTFIDWFTKVWTGLTEFWKRDWAAAVYDFQHVGEKLKQVGQDVINGLLGGFKAKWADVTAWIRQAAADIENLFRLTTKTHSDSQVFYDIGHDIFSGLASGLQDSIKLPLSVIGGFAPAATGGMGSFGGGGGNNVTFYITGGDPKEIARQVAITLKLNGIQTL